MISQIFNDKIATSRLFRKSFNCRYMYNPRMDYAFCLLRNHSLFHDWLA